MYIYIYIYIYVCVCVCVCVCVHVRANLAKTTVSFWHSIYLIPRHGQDLMQIFRLGRKRERVRKRGRERYIYIYIYIYIFTNLISTSIHGIGKNKKTWSGTRDKSTSNHHPGEKEKGFLGKKERKGQPRPTPWKKSRGTHSVVKRKPKDPPRMLQCYNY